MQLYCARGYKDCKMSKSDVLKTHHKSMILGSLNAHKSQLSEYIHMFLKINYPGGRINDLLLRGHLPLKSATCTKQSHQGNIPPLYSVSSSML